MQCQPRGRTPGDHPGRWHRHHHLPGRHRHQHPQWRARRCHLTVSNHNQTLIFTPLNFRKTRGIGQQVWWVRGSGNIHQGGRGEQDAHPHIQNIPWYGGWLDGPSPCRGRHPQRGQHGPEGGHSRRRCQDSKEHWESSQTWGRTQSVLIKSDTKLTFVC